MGAELAPIAGTSCAIAPHWSINSLPRRILDEIWRRDRKNEQRGAEKPILRKTAFRTDEMGPISGKYGFVLLHLRFTARRRRLTLFPAIILEVTSSYGGIRSCRSASIRRAPSAPIAAPDAESLHASTAFARVTGANNQLQRLPPAGPPAAPHRHRVRVLIG